MKPIPSANISELDISAIAKRAPVEAEMIASIAAKMRTGHETDQEFIQLCELLHDVGYGHIAKSLLIANSDGVDEASKTLVKLFPECQTAYDTAITSFQRQYKVSLVLVCQRRIFCCVYRFVSERFRQIFWDCGSIEVTNFEIQITLESDGAVVGDVYAPNYNWAVPLQFDGEEWGADDS